MAFHTLHHSAQLPPASESAEMLLHAALSDMLTSTTSTPMMVCLESAQSPLVGSPLFRRACSGAAQLLVDQEPCMVGIPPFLV